MKHSPLGVALLGVGRMGAVHLRVIRDHVSDVRVLAVAEPRAEAAAGVGGLAGGAVEVYADASAALRHPGVEACIVVTPTDTHAEVVASALDAGVHVFCEKPLTLDAERSRELGESARARGLTLQVGFWRRFCPPIVEARRLLVAGAIGKPVLVRSSQWDVEGPPASWCDPARSGGVFVDMGVHELDEIEWLLDQRVDQIEGRPLALVDQSLAAVGDYDNALALLSLSGGATGLIDLSRNGRYADDIRIEILGSGGAIFVETVPQGRVRLGQRGGLKTVWESDSDGFVEAVAGQLRAFTSAVAGVLPGDALPGAEESVRATSLGDAALRSAREGRPIDVS